MHWNRRSAALHHDVATNVDIRSIRRIEEEAYSSRLTLIVRNVLEMPDAALVINSLEYNAFPLPFDSLDLWANVENWWRGTQFKRRFRIRRHAALFVNVHCVDIFCIPTRDREKAFFPQLRSSPNMG